MSLSLNKTSFSPPSSSVFCHSVFMSFQRLSQRVPITSSKRRNGIVMYKLDECQSLNSHTSEHIPTKFDTGRGQVNAIGAKIISFHTCLLQHILHKKQKQFVSLLSKNGNFSRMRNLQTAYVKYYPYLHFLFICIFKVMNINEINSGV